VKCCEDNLFCHKRKTCNRIWGIFIADYDLIDEGLPACHFNSDTDTERHSDFGQDFLDSFLEGLLLFFGDLITGSYQSGYDIGCLEVQVDSLRLLFQKFPELYSEQGNLLVDSLDMRSFLQLQFFCFIKSPAIETPWTTFFLAFSFYCNNIYMVP
jgi:hypothetical protein